ncbi:hypothetical protein KCP73_04125 [Salmonella enterica subsp. enterica]|nr:hypothetical protein KCP73_04125 [Salmonella enterica subsp. enterica]
MNDSWLLRHQLMVAKPPPRWKAGREEHGSSQPAGNDDMLQTRQQYLRFYDGTGKAGFSAASPKSHEVRKLPPSLWITFTRRERALPASTGRTRHWLTRSALSDLAAWRYYCERLTTGTQSWRKGITKEFSAVLLRALFIPIPVDY